MIGFLRNKALGFYFGVLAGLIAIISIISFMTWAPARHAMNPLILIMLILALVLDGVLFFYDNDYLMIIITACFGVALFQLLADSVGSFVDAYQGIVMFGDSSQVGTILTISATIALGALATIIASFMKRVKT